MRGENYGRERMWRLRRNMKERQDGGCFKIGHALQSRPLFVPVPRIGLLMRGILTPHPFGHVTK